MNSGHIPVGGVIISGDIATTSNPAFVPLPSATT